MGALRDASRSLRRRPAFLSLAVFTMALGIGATSTMFSAIDAVLFAPLPYADSDRLVLVHQRTPEGERTRVAVIAANAWREGARSMEGLALHAPWNRILTGAGAPEELRIQQIEAHMLELLGARPLLGPGFGEEHRSVGGRNDAVILSWGLWQRRFGGDPGVIGSQIQLQDDPYTIVGVMPRDFEFPIDAQIAAWTPYVFAPLEPGSFPYRAEYESPNFEAVARVSSSATQERLEAELTAIVARIRIADSYGAEELRDGWSAELSGMHEAMIGSGRGLEALFAAVLLVMLIACANVANLFLVRGTERQRELSIRLALGASRRDLVIQLGAEGVLVTVLGLVLGTVMAAWLTELIVVLDPGDLPRWQGIGLDTRSLTFTMALAGAASLIGGLLPAVLVARTSLATASIDEQRTGGTRSRVRVRRALIVAELVVAFVLFTGSALLVRSYVRLQAVNPGFEPDRVITARLILSADRYGTWRDRLVVNRFYDELLGRLRASPGVEAAGAASTLPMSASGVSWTDSLRRAGTPGSPAVPAIHRFATPGYFAAIGVAVRGREFTLADGPGAPPVAILNRSAARRLFGAGDPIGRVIDSGSDQLEVVGVVDDVRHAGLASPAQPEFYEAAATFPHLAGLLVAVRTTGAPEPFMTRLEAIVHDIDPLIPVANLTTMSRLVSRSIARERFNTVILGTLACVGLTLLTIGVYGVMTHGVTQRRREVAVRMALGARRGQIAGLVLGDTLRLIAIGGLIGLLISLAGANLLRGLLFGISPHDPVSLVMAGALLFLIGVVAAVRPATMAARTSLITSLKEG